MKRKVLSMLLVAAMTASLCACTNTATNPSGESSNASTEQGSTASSVDGGNNQQTDVVTPSIAWADMEYDDASAYVYDAALGEFSEPSPRWAGRW